MPNKNLAEKYGNIKLYSYFCKNNTKEVTMVYTKELLRVKNPSSRLLKLISNLRENKKEQMEKLRSMKPEDFDMRVSL